MVPISLPLGRRDSALLSDLYRVHSGLITLSSSLLRNAPKSLPALDVVKQHIDCYQQAYEGGKTGNHAQIALRNKARKAVIMLFRSILYYLQSIATEDDIPALIQAGFSIRQVGRRKKVVVAPAC